MKVTMKEVNKILAVYGNFSNDPIYANKFQSKDSKEAIKIMVMGALNYQGKKIGDFRAKTKWIEATENDPGVILVGYEERKGESKSRIHYEQKQFYSVGEPAFTPLIFSKKYASSHFEKSFVGAGGKLLMSEKDEGVSLFVGEIEGAKQSVLSRSKSVCDVIEKNINRSGLKG